MVSIVWSMGKKFSDEKVIFSKFVIRLKSQSKSKHNELTLFCFCHNKNKEKNNPNIQDLSELVVLNLVKRLNSKRKIKLCWLRKMIFNLNFMVSCFFLFCFKYRKYNFFCDKNTLLWISMGSVFFGKYVFYPKFYFNLIISSYFISL